MSNNQEEAISSGFIVTKEYRRFAEFCDACRRDRYIGLCYGSPGVGKTFSAWHYAQWNLVEAYFPERFYDTYRLSAIRQVIAGMVAANVVPWSPALEQCRSILYTPSVTTTPKQVAQEVQALRLVLSYLVDVTKSELWREPVPHRGVADPTELILVDEADRLKPAALEQLRDIYDQSHLGLVLIGMPGIEKRLARYPQLYSRVGFVHQFRPLSTEEIHFLLEHKWDQFGITLQPDDFTDREVIATVIRITGGNFRLIQRLCLQIERVLRINKVGSGTNKQDMVDSEVQSVLK
jgi:DNA transposition AAA+ family ATPase